MTTRAAPRQLLEPAARLSEQVIIGTLLYAPELYQEYGAGLPLDAFTDEKCRTIFAEIHACERQGIAWTRYLLAQRLCGRDRRDKSGITPADLAEYPYHFTCTEQMLPLEVNTVREAWVLRLAMQQGATLTRAYVPGLPAASVLASAQCGIAALQGFLARPQPASVRSILIDYCCALRDSEHPRPIPTRCLPTFDRLCGGLVPGTLILFGARPSCGKTAIGISLANEVAAQDFPVYYFSTETTKELTALRFQSYLSGIDPFDIRTGKAGANDLARVPWPVGVTVNDAMLTLPQFLAELREWRRYTICPAVVIVDYLELISLPEVRDQEPRLSAIIRGLHAAAKELRLPLVVMSQLSRPGVNQQGKEPLLTAFRGSGMIEQCADVAVFAWSKKETEGEIQPIILSCKKNKLGGRPWSVDAQIERSRSRVSEVSKTNEGGRA